ncbi:MAG: 16S rRNA (guanine(966)-N(2))-methyltransferase RsmD [Deltaproteobacteria bacterium RIFCSPHIGHO2_12_FULL_43_9]|nr:MAG: 16S rRNA (guanine(966)-N(2))-methyltransferase RsmD [Deltaproteobacteria bacterium RIFCSPHIGHO2_12_FULL_43_9]
MRIIAGSLKGRIIKTVKGLTVRPMLDQIRESLFNILGSSLSDATVIDCFAGSGAVGLEALSRGAGKVIFFEENRVVAKVLRSNIEKCGVLNRAELIVGSLPASLKMVKEGVDIAFLDPPFGKAVGLKTLQVVSTLKWLKKGALVIFRAPKEAELLDAYPPLHRYDQRIYGRSKLSFFRKTE